MKEYICFTNQGQFEFFADNKTLAVDHAQYHCAQMGWIYRSVQKVAK
jgi:hypothetical protein